MPEPTPTPIPSTPTDATLAGLEPRATDLSSKGLKLSWPERLKEQSLFSARTTLKSYVDMIRKRLVEVATRAIIPQEAERMLRRTLEDVGYSPVTGFPDDKGRVPPAKPGSIRDLSSSRRIQLILDTNVKQARSLGQIASSENPVFLMTNPAWRLTRTGARKKPRGDWKRRWAAAGAACGWKGALKNQMCALKSSPIWQKLGDGTGGFQDCIGTPYPPFAFGSGMAWVNVGRREWRRLCEGEGIPDGLEEIASIAKATRAAQEAAGGKGAYGASAKPGAAAGVARGLMERLWKGGGTAAAFMASATERDSAKRALSEAVMDATAAISAIRKAVSRIKAALIADTDDDEATATASKAAASLASTEGEIEKARKRIEAYLKDVESAALPKDAAAQAAFDGRMKKLKAAAEKTREIVRTARSGAEKKANAVLALLEG